MKWVWRIAGAASALAVMCVITTLSLSTRVPRDFDSLSTYSTEPGGTGALYRLAQESGFAVSRSTRSLSRLEPGTFALVLFVPPPPAAREDQIEGEPPPMTAEEARAVADLARSGSPVLVFGAQYLPPDALAALDIRVAPPTPNAKVTASIPLPIGGNPDVSVPEGVLSAGGNWIPLLTVGGGAYALLRDYGKGRLIVCAEGLAFSNRRLRRGDNAEVALTLLSATAQSSRELLFDETLHGYREEEGLTARIGRPGRFALAQLFILFLVVAYSVGKRFGYPLALRPRRPALGEYVTAVATLYERAGAPGLALRTIRKDALRRISALARIPIRGGEQPLIASLPKDLRSALAMLEKAATDDADPAYAARHVRRLDQEIETFRTEREAEHPRRTTKTDSPR